MPISSSCTPPSARTPEWVPRSGAWLLCSFVALCPAPLRGAAIEEPIRLAYEGPPTCGSTEELWARIRTRTARARPARRDEPGRSFFVRLDPQAKTVRGRLTIVATSGPPTEREIETGSCAQAVDGLSLIITLALDPTPSSVPAPQSGNGTAERGAKPAEGSSRPSKPGEAPTPGSERATDGTSRGGQPPQGSDRTNLAVSARTQGSDHANLAVAEVQAVDAQEMESPRAPTTFAFWAAVAGYGVSGLSPEVLLGGRLGAELASTTQGYLAPALRVSLGYAGHPGFSRPGATANFSYGFSNLEACLMRFGIGQLALRACVAGDLGLEWAWGSNTPEPHAETRFWADVGPEARVEWGISRSFRLELGFATLLPVRRDRFLIGKNAVHQVEPAEFAGFLGVAGRIP